METFFGIILLFTILLPNVSLGLPINVPRIHHHPKLNVKNLRKLCTLPIWYGKTHIYHSKMCTIIRNIDSMTTTKPPIITATSTILPSTTTTMSTTTVKVPIEKPVKVQKKKACKMVFEPLARSGSGSVAHLPKIQCFWVDLEYRKDMSLLAKSTSTPQTTTTKSPNEVYSFLRY